MGKLIIGSHVKMASPTYLKGSVNEAISYGANSMMIYTGAPQNTRRTDVEKLNIEQMWDIWNKNDMTSVVVHAPYIINLANTLAPEKAEFGRDFLIQEINRVDAIGAQILVLHPGSHVKQGLEVGLDSIVSKLDEVFESTIESNVKIALETMAGKGSECCFEFAHIKYIIDNCKYPHRLGVCFDTCHVFDAGYDIVNDLEGVISKLEENELLEKILVIHLNDSKNILGSKKDRHENIGFGNIGFESLINVAYHEKFSKIPKILETPYIGKTCVYAQEISMIKNKEFIQNIFDEIKISEN